METIIIPPYLDVFLSVIRDNQVAQVAVVAVLVLILCDWVFGIANAIMHHEFDSEKMRQGLYHKCAEIGLLLVGLIADGALLGGFDLGYTAPMFTAFCAYICVMEVGSLMETFALMNPELGNSAPFKLLASVTEHAGQQSGEDDE